MLKMIEFNEDGSIKLPDHMLESKRKTEFQLKKGNCALIKREILSSTSPKKCALNIKLSDAINDNRFVENIYKYFCENSSTPTKLNKLNEKEFTVEVGTNFKRCSDCNNLIRRYREFLDNVIEHKGSCTYETNKNFCYEDYFD